MEKLVFFDSAYDKRHPDPSKNYGIHGVTLKFVLKGKLGATNFTIYTTWHLPEVQQELIHRTFGGGYDVEMLLPMPADFGYHSPKKLYEYSTLAVEGCPYLNGKPCYCDGSSLYAETVYEKLLREGDDAVWKELEESYIDRFGQLK